MSKEPKPAAAKSEDEIWKGDRLNRREDANYLRAFIESRITERGSLGRKRSYVLNLDAGWGRGKTFFLERFAEQVAQQGHIVAYVNAWRDDFSDDPLVAVMSAIDAAVDPHIPKKGAVAKAYKAVTSNFGGILWAGAKGVAGQALKKVVGDGISEIAEMVGDPTTVAQKEAGDKSNTETLLSAGSEAVVREVSDRLARQAIDDFAAARKSVSDFKDRLEELLEALAAKNIPMPLYVLVDELDRCRPPFAIAMLERVKHLFEADNVAFLVATDTEQLQHSIRAVYGSEFASGTYLNRFFDRTYRFDQPDPHPYLASLMEASPIPEGKLFLFDQDIGRFMADTFEYLGASLRDIEQAYDLVRTVCTTWTYPVPIQLGALLPLAVALVRAIEPALSKDTVSQLINSRPKGWQQRPRSGFQLRMRDRGSFDTSEIHVTPSSLFNEFVNRTSSSLPDLARSPANSGITYLVDVELGREFAVVYGSQYSTGQEPHSVVRTYPDIIKRAGRLLR